MFAASSLLLGKAAQLFIARVKERKAKTPHIDRITGILSRKKSEYAGHFVLLSA